MSNPLEELQKKLDELGIEVDKHLTIEPKTVKVRTKNIDKQIELFTQLKGLLEIERDSLAKDLMDLEDKLQQVRKGGSNGGGK